MKDSDSDGWELVVELTPEESAGLAKEFAQIDRLRAAVPGSEEYASAYLDLYRVLPTERHIANATARRANNPDGS